MCGLLWSAAAPAQWAIDRLVIAGGGGESTGGAWSLAGTLGQAEAHVVPLCSTDGADLCEGASFELFGGFWAGLADLTPPGCGADPDCIFLDGFEGAP